MVSLVPVITFVVALNRTRPVVEVLTVVVPPMVGFFGKFYVLKAAVDADMIWLATAGAVASVIGAFYYLRIVFFMYFGKETEGVESRMAPAQWAMLVAVAVIMVVGIVNLFGIEPAAAIAAEALVR